MLDSLKTVVPKILKGAITAGLIASVVAVINNLVKAKKSGNEKVRLKTVFKKDINHKLIDAEASIKKMGSISVDKKDKFNISKYYDGNRISREQIALDIRYRRLSHNDLLHIISDPKISAAFYGKSYEDKIPKDQWDEEYLEKLSYAVVGENFNKDYLLYLEEVAITVSSQKISFIHTVLRGLNEGVSMLASWLFKKTHQAID